MSVTGKGQVSQRASFLVLFSILALVLSAMALVRPLVSDVSATHVEPTTVPGNENKTCGTLVDGLDYEFKIDPFPQSAGVYVYDDPNSELVVTITVAADGSFSFSTNIAVNAVFVKGGNDGGGAWRDVRNSRA